MKVNNLRLNVLGLVIAFLAVNFDRIVHPFFENAFPTYYPEVFLYSLVKFLVIYIVFIILTYLFLYLKPKFIESLALRPAIIAFTAMIIFGTYYFFFPSNSDPRLLPFAFFPLMGLNHFFDILISILLLEYLIRNK